MRKYLAVFFLCAVPAQTQNIYTIAGLPYTHRNSVDSQPALKAPLGAVYGLLIDKISGRLIFNDELLVERLEPDGSLLALVGTGAFNTPPPLPSAATLASALGIEVLRGMAQDASGVLYLADAEAGRVYRVALDGTVTTFAGGGSQPPGFQSDGGPATAASLVSPRGLVFDSKGNLDIAEVYCNCIRRVTPGGIISTVYTLPPSNVRGRLPNVEGLAIDKQDNLYFTEWFGNVLVKLAPDGSPASVAGTGDAGFSGDNGPAAAAKLNGPSGVTLDANGNIYVADSMNNRIRKIAADGTISTVAGAGTCGFSGDGGPAQLAQLCRPAEIIFDSSGNLLIADYGNRRVRMMSLDGTISTITGSGLNDPNLSFSGSKGDGGPAIHATFSMVSGAAFDQSGNLYVSDSQADVIRKIAADGTVSTFAGNGQVGYTGDGGPALQAEFFRMGPLAVAPDGSVYVITGDSRVRKITPDGIVHLVAGTGTGNGINRSQGDGGPAVNATLNEPGEVAFDRFGNTYIADTSNSRIRKIDANGIITTVAGPAQQGVDYYNGVAVDTQGNLYLSWTHAPPPNISASVNRVNPDGSLTRIAGNGQPCMGQPFTEDGLPALQAHLCAVIGLAVGPNGLLNLSEGVFSEVLRLAPDGTIHRVAGDSAATSIGDGGPARDASLVGGQGFSPQIVTFDPVGNMYFSEPGRNIVREVTYTPYMLTVSPAHIDVAGTSAQTQTVTMSANFSEPFAYAVRISTSDGGSWLSANRVTGITPESFQVIIDPSGLAPGSYRGTVSVIVENQAGSVLGHADIGYVNEVGQKIG